MLVLCETDLERVKIQLLRMRQYVAAARLGDAVNLFWSTLTQYGYDPESPTSHQVVCPATADEVALLVVPLNFAADDPPDEDIPSVVMSMMGE